MNPAPAPELPRSARPSELAALVTLPLFLLLPLLLHPIVGAVSHAIDVLFIFNLATSLLWLLLFHLASTRPIVTYLRLAPLFGTTAIDLFLLYTFKGRLSSSYVTIALTDYAETGDFLSAYAQPLALAVLVLLAVYLPAVYAIRHVRRKPSRRAAAAAAALLVAIYGAGFGWGVSHGTSMTRSVLDVMGKDLGAPVGVVFQTGLAVQMLEDAKELRQQRVASTLHAHKPIAAEGEIYVWVIGESSRPRNWSLFGYGRDTTPRLRATPGVVGLPAMLTTAPHTSIAVPSMLSLQPITDWPAVIGTRSVVSAFNEAGFKTYWLSAQEADSWGGYVPWVAAEARHRRYFDRVYDGVLLDEFRKILSSAGNAEKLFIVLHTKGSHFDYSRRYPPEFDRFKTPGGSYRDSVRDSYDNSVLYTDWFVSEVIASLAARHGQSALVYASDHGENLLDDDQRLLGHAVGNPYDLETAALFWLSDPLRQRLPGAEAALRNNAGAALSLENLPHSMLHLAGIQADGLDPKRSVFSEAFAPRKRSYIVRGALRAEMPGAPGAEAP